MQRAVFHAIREDLRTQCSTSSQVLNSLNYARRPRALVGHLEEQQVCQLFDVVTVAHPVVAQDVAVVPEFLDDRGWTHGAPIRTPYLIHDPFNWVLPISPLRRLLPQEEIVL